MACVKSGFSKKVESRLVVVRSHFERLLSVQKPLRDQLLFELPCLQGLRTGEISSLRVKYIDFERGIFQVLDSKKNVLCPLPMRYVVAQHLAEYIREMRLKDDDILIRALPHANRKIGHKPGAKTQGLGLSNAQIERRWLYWCDVLGLPRYEPRMGRAFFACVWHFVQRKSMFHLMVALRHDDIQSTQHYVSRLVNFEDFRVEFLEGDFVVVDEARCERSDKCPHFIEGCHCKFFTPQVKSVDASTVEPLRVAVSH